MILFFLFFMNVIQIISLYFYSSFTIFLVLQIIFTLLSNINISRIVDKQYPYLKNKNVIKLEEETKEEIKKMS